MKRLYHPKHMYNRGLAYLVLLLLLAALFLYQKSFDFAQLVVLGVIAVRAYVSVWGNKVELDGGELHFKIQNKSYTLKADEILSIGFPEKKEESKEFPALLFKTAPVPEIHRLSEKNEKPSILNELEAEADLEKDKEKDESGHLLFNYAIYSREDIEAILRYAVSANPNIECGRTMNTIRFEDSMTATEKNYYKQKSWILIGALVVVGVGVFIEGQRGWTLQGLTKMLVELIKIVT